MSLDLKLLETDKKIDLLDSNESLAQSGWAKAPIWKYSRSHINKSSGDIKEWDRYIIFDSNGTYLVIASAFETARRITCSITYANLNSQSLVRKSRTYIATKAASIPENSTDNCQFNYSSTEMRLTLIRQENDGNILLSIPKIPVPNFGSGIDARFHYLINPQSQIYTSAFPIDKTGRSFLLNQVTPIIIKAGFLRLGEQTLPVSENNTIALFEYGRGKVSEKHLGRAIICGMTDQGPISINIIHRDQCAILFNGKTYMNDQIQLTQTHDCWNIRTKDNKVDLMIKSLMQRQEEFEPFSKEINSMLTIAIARGFVDLVGTGSKLSINGLPVIVNSVL